MDLGPDPRGVIDEIVDIKQAPTLEDFEEKDHELGLLNRVCSVVRQSKGIIENSVLKGLGKCPSVQFE